MKVSGAILFFGGILMLAYQLTGPMNAIWIQIDAAEAAIGLSMMIIGRD